MATATLFIAMAREWIGEESVTENKGDILSQKLEEIQEEIHILDNKQFENAKSDYQEALRWRKDRDKFAKYIECAYDKCRDTKSMIIESYNKIYLYSLLISSGFIYYSDFGINYIKGLREIYFILIDMNSDIELRKDLQTALQSKIYWTNSERKLINAVIHFSIRLNLFIQQIFCEIYLKMKQDQISDDNEKYLEIDWLPTYYDGYYFGKVSNKPHKYSKLCPKDLQNVMDAEKTTYRIKVDDLIIHSNDLSNTGLFIKKHTQFIHHWYSLTDWIDFSYVEEFKIFVILTNNGKIYSLVVNMYDTIKMIKNKICEKEGNISTAMLRMEYNNKRLQDVLTLYHYNISKNSRLKASLITFNPFLNFLS